MSWLAFFSFFPFSFQVSPAQVGWCVPVSSNMLCSRPRLLFQLLLSQVAGLIFLPDCVGQVVDWDIGIVSHRTHMPSWPPWQQRIAINSSIFSAPQKRPKTILARRKSRPKGLKASKVFYFLLYSLFSVHPTKDREIMRALNFCGQQRVKMGPQRLVSGRPRSDKSQLCTALHNFVDNDVIKKKKILAQSNCKNHPSRKFEETSLALKAKRFKSLFACTEKVFQSCKNTGYKHTTPKNPSQNLSRKNIWPTSFKLNARAQCKASAKTGRDEVQTSACFKVFKTNDWFAQNRKLEETLIKLPLARDSSSHSATRETGFVVAVNLG